MARPYIPVAVERAMRQRARERCEYCQSPSAIASAPFSLDHIHPDSLGGSSDESNLAFSCSFCNGAKGDKTHAPDPETGLPCPLFHPRRDRWSDHFQWSEGALSIVALTPVGRATLAALGLNRVELQNLRRVLVRSEIHPPADT